MHRRNYEFLKGSKNYCENSFCLILLLSIGKRESLLTPRDYCKKYLQPTAYLFTTPPPNKSHLTIQKTQCCWRPSAKWGKWSWFKGQFPRTAGQLGMRHQHRCDHPSPLSYQLVGGCHTRLYATLTLITQLWNRQQNRESGRINAAASSTQQSLFSKAPHWEGLPSMSSTFSINPTTT